MFQLGKIFNDNFSEGTVVQLLIKQLLTKKKTPPHPSTQEDKKKKVSLLSQLCFMSLFFC